MVDYSNDETNSPHKLLLTHAVSRLRKAFANTSIEYNKINVINNNIKSNIKFSKTQLSKTMQSGEFLVRLIEPLLKTGLPSQKMYLQN